jgi:hypothetical protein
MNKMLVGYTGFVGSNIYAKGDFDGIYNSKNIQEAYGKNPDLLIYSGLRAEKFLANNAPEKDLKLIYGAEKNIEKINPKKLILISTIDVLKKPINVDEDVEIETIGLQAYGYNRYQLECWVRENYPDALIIRLPGLYGINLKKNFIYDFINIIPSMLKEEKMKELLLKNSDLTEYYKLGDNGFYKLTDINENQKKELRNILKSIQFTALNFTDSRNVYQFYPLERLWKDIKICLENNIKLWHPATEPISASELYAALTGETFENEILDKSLKYNFKTKYFKEFNGHNGYIMSKKEILEDIKKFIKKNMKL